MSLHTAGNLDRPQDFPAFPLFSENMFSFSQVLTDVSALEKKASILLTKSKGAFIAKRILGKGHQQYFLRPNRHDEIPLPGLIVACFHQVLGKPFAKTTIGTAFATIRSSTLYWDDKTRQGKAHA